MNKFQNKSQIREDLYKNLSKKENKLRLLIDNLSQIKIVNMIMRIITMKKKMVKTNMNMMIMKAKKVHRAHYLMKNIQRIITKKITRIFPRKFNSKNRFNKGES